MLISKSPPFLIKFHIFSVYNSANQLSVRQLIWFAYTSSYIAFFSCIGLTIFKDLKITTTTRCKAFNFLPTVSMAIGFCYPQCYIWRFCFALSSFPRYFIAYLQTKQRASRPGMALSKLYLFVERLNGFIHCLELTCLLLLSYISLREFEWIHVYSYIGFFVFSQLHMLFTVGIDYIWPRSSYAQITDLEKKLRAKRLKWFLINMASFFISIYFHFRHNWFCEPMIYSMHSLFEYFFILTNIAYHTVAVEDWSRRGTIKIYF